MSVITCEASVRQVYFPEVRLPLELFVTSACPPTLTLALNPSSSVALCVELCWRLCSSCLGSSLSLCVWMLICHAAGLAPIAGALCVELIIYLSKYTGSSLSLHGCMPMCQSAGLAPIAGALCVELLAALLQHPQQVAVKPLGGSLEWEANEHTQPRHVHGNLHQPQQQKQQQQQQQQQQGRDLQGEGSDEAALGGVPHMLRGNLTGFNLTCMEGRAFSQCTACSSTVVRQFRQQGWELVLRATQVGGAD
eukprot:1138071-Pelagomonas_calceolata.AAC.4